MRPTVSRAVVLADGATYRKLIVDEQGQTAGAILLGDIRGAELLTEAVRTGREAGDPLALLAEASQATAADLPDSARVCNCHGVCKGEIVDAIRTRNLGSTLEVINVTRAGAGCGSCKPLVGELLQIERGGAAEEATYLCPCRRQTREELAAVVRERGLESVSELSAACGAGRDCGACKPGLAYLVSEICGNRHREERHARFINDRVHANIQNDGTFSVVPRIRGGVTTADELRRIADVADRHEVPLIKITGGQRIDLLGIRKEQLPAIWEELDMPSGHAYAKAVRTVKTCVGTDFCRFGLGDAMGVGIELERAMEGLYTPHKVKSAVTGCPRNCAEAYVKDIGLVAVEGGWELYVGGAAGATVRKGDLLTTVTTSDEAMRVALAFLQHYRESAEYLERTYTYLERTGIDSGENGRARPHGRAARALPDRQGRRRPRPLARAPRARPPPSVRGARLMTAIAAPWTLVGRSDDIPLLEGRSTSIDGRRIAIFRLLDGYAAIDAHCPHAHGPLHDGIVADSCVTCPLHGRRFDLSTGEALNGPESVDRPRGRRARRGDLGPTCLTSRPPARTAVSGAAWSPPSRRAG